jgi:DNA-binding IclR family transcriptional regulator
MQKRFNRYNTQILTMKFLLQTLPTVWTAGEIAVAVGVSLRQVQRVLKLLVEHKVVEKVGTSYSIHLEVLGEKKGNITNLRKTLKELKDDRKFSRE